MMPKRRLSRWILVAALSVVPVVSADVGSAVSAPVITRASVNSAGLQASGESRAGSISDDGCYVAFVSGASDLVPGDTNGQWDVFVRDRVAGITTRVSVGPGNTQANGSPWGISISGDGRYVAYASESTNLVAGDTNGVRDIFVYDRVGAVTTRVSVDSSGAQGNEMSRAPCISGDGRYIAFHSLASNLVGDDTNGKQDIFLHDRVTGETTRVNVSSTGAQANDVSYDPAISSDGRYVAFESSATTLASNDTNNEWDVFVHDRITGETVLGSLSATGQQGNDYSGYASISGDGRYLAFCGIGSNMVAGDTNGVWDIFVRDLVNGTTSRVSLGSAGVQPNSNCYSPKISADGRCVAFMTEASNLDANDTNAKLDIYLRDLLTGTTARCSAGSSVASGYAEGDYPSISSDGHYVSFESASTDLVAADTNSVGDVFVAEMSLVGAPCTVPLSTASVSSLPFGAAFEVTGTLQGGGAGLAGRRVVLQSALPDAQFKNTSQAATTSADGTFAFSTSPKVRTRYRVRFEGSFGFAQAFSSERSALPKVRLKRSTSWSTLSRTRTYYAKGSIEPRHYSSSGKVRIRAYKKKSDGTYRYVKSFSANYSYYSSTKTKYKAAVRLTSKGTWKLVAYHAADAKNAKTYGSADYVRVR